MPENTVNLVSTTNPPTTDPSTTNPPASNNPVTDDEFIELANFTRLYHANFCPKGIVTCLEVDGKRTQLQRVPSHSQSSPNYDATILVQENSLRALSPKVWENFSRVGPPEGRPILGAAQGTRDTKINYDENGNFSAAVILTNMKEIDNPPSSLFPPGCDRNKAYECRIVETDLPLSERMDPVCNWEPSLRPVRYTDYTTGEWTKVPAPDSSEAS
jgi:hypothetical protein